MATTSIAPAAKFLNVSFALKCSSGESCRDTETDRETETERQSEVALTPGVSPRRAHSLPQTRTPAGTNTPLQPLPPPPEAIPLWCLSRPSGDSRGGRQDGGERDKGEDVLSGRTRNVLKSPQRGKEGRRRSVMVAWQWRKVAGVRRNWGSWFWFPVPQTSRIKELTSKMVSGFVSRSQSHAQTVMTL